MVFCASARAEAQPRAPWGDASISVGGVALLPSDYDETLRIFDHAPLSGAVSSALRVTRSLLPWASIGGRLGWLWTSSAVRGDPSDPSASPLSSMSFNVVDLSAVLRLVATPSRVATGGARVHVDVEAGASLGMISMSSVTQRWVRPRVAAGLFAGYQDARVPLYFGARVGVEYVPWNGAGGSDTDPVFSGPTAGIELGYTP